MPLLPARFAAIILAFAPLFVQRSWRCAQVLLVGAILTSGQRTVASLLRVTGRARAPHRELPSDPQPRGLAAEARPRAGRRQRLLRPRVSSTPCAQTGVWGGVTAITRLRLDAALCEPAPPRPPGTIGRPRTKGTRLLTLSGVLADPGTGWRTIVVPGWYGAGECTVEITSATAVWRHGGVAARRPAGRSDGC